MSKAYRTNLVLSMKFWTSFEKHFVIHSNKNIKTVENALLEALLFLLIYYS